MLNETLPSRSKRLLSYTIIFLTAVYPLHPAWGAAMTAADKNTQISQQNNVPIINIATPNGAGISHNKFQQFNVDKQGAVLNNATANVNSQIAGQIKANANLKGKSANLIINEVTGSSRSELQGKLEVAGKGANVLIANPNGITCNGCSFVNTPAITLTTGKPILDNKGALSAIEVKKGSVVIGANGLNAEAQTYADIISRATELNGQIKAKNLTLMQGTNRVDFQKGTVTPITGEGTKPSISVDTKALGGMYANQVKLVSTEAGVGINLSNVQINQNDLTLTVDGKITLAGNIQGKKDINVSTKNLQINTNAKVSATKDITLATNTLVNNGQVTAGKDMRVFADNVSNTGNNALIQAQDNLWMQKNAKGDLSTLIENKSGTIKTNTGDLVIRTKRLNNEKNVLSVKPEKLELATERKLIDYYGKLDTNPGIVNFSLGITLGQNQNYSQLKWFDVLDTRTYGEKGFLGAESFNFNTEKQLWRIEQSSNSATISSGKNAYINANELHNQSHITAKQNLILTGLNFTNTATAIGYDKKFLHYKNLRPNYSTNIPANTDVTALSVQNLWHENDVIGGSLAAGANLVLDFKNSINFLKNIPVTNKAFNEKWLSGKDIFATANNMLLNSGQIKLTGTLTAKNDLNVISNNDITLNEGKLTSARGLSVTTTKNLNIINSQLTTQDLSLLAKGNISINQSNNLRLYMNGEKKINQLSGSNSVIINTDGLLNIENTFLSKSKSYNIYSGENTTISNNLDKLDSKSLYYTAGIKTNEPNTDFLALNSDIITVTSKKDLSLKGLNLSGNSINLHAGKDIVLSSKLGESNTTEYYSSSDPKVSSLVNQFNANKEVNLNSGRDLTINALNLTSKDKITILSGRNIILKSAPYNAIQNTNDDLQDKHFIQTNLSSDKGITIASNGALTTQGSAIKSLGDITISSGGNVRLESVKTHYRKQEGKRLEDLYRQIGTEINSGKTLTILSEGSILFQASRLVAKGTMDIADKGGYLYAQAMEETSHYEESGKKCNKWTACITKKEVKKTRSETKNKVTEFTAGGDINLYAKDDVTLEATKINSGKNAKITSQTGKVNFKAVKNTTFEQVISNSKGFYITQRNKGYTEDKWILPALHIGGKLTIDAAKGITADIKAKNNQSLQNALNALGQTEGTKWLAGLKDRKDVQWGLVKDAYDSWDYKSQSLNPVASALIMITVAAMTSGTASQFAAWAASGTSGTTAAVISGAAYSGMTALSSQAAVALAENQGNLSKTLNSLGKSDTVKSIITQMVISGALNGLDAKMGWTTGNPGDAKLPLLSHGDWNKVAQRVAAQSVISSTVNTTIQGGSFTDNFKTALLSNIGNQVNAEGAKLIGDNGEILGRPGKMISHAALSGLSAEIKQANSRGAIVGALAAELAAISLGDNTIKAEEWQKKSEAQAQFARAFGGFAGAIFTGNAGGVYSGADAAESTFRYNYLSHHQDTLKNKELAAEPNDFKKALIAMKWLYIDIDQDVAFGAGMIGGIPAGLYETIEGLANLANNPKETYSALRAVLMSDDTLGIMTDSLRQSYLSRLNKMETEYQKAGTEGAFKAGVEGGKLIFDIAGTFAGGAGIAKGGVNLVEKVSIKITSRGLIGTTSNGYRVYNGSNTMVPKSSLEHPIIQSRINVKTGDNKSGWNHVLDRHFSDKNASQFTISQTDLKSILQSNDISKVPISRIISSSDGPRFERVIILDKNIGTDKFNGYQATNTMTILTDNQGNLITTHPGRLP